MSDLPSAARSYLAAFPRTRPEHAVVRLGAARIRAHAQERFGGRLLDIGCGSKAKQKLVGDLVDEYIGVDHEHTPHDRTKADIVATAYDIPVPDRAFDCVLCTAVLEHLEDPRAALEEAYRVLAPGGWALYTAPFFWHLHEEPRDFYRYSKYGLGYLFDAAGFEVHAVEPLGGFFVTAMVETAYFLQRFRRGPLRILVDAGVAAINTVAPRLDQGRLRDERFSWLHLVVARRPPD